MAALKARHNKWEARVRVPQALRAELGGKEHLYRTLTATDKRAAKLEASAWEVSLKTAWAARSAAGGSQQASLRHLYNTFRTLAEQGHFTAEVGNPDPMGYDEVTEGIDLTLSLMADAAEDRPLTVEEQAKVWALGDARDAHMGQKVKPRQELQATFRELADEHLRLWKIAPGRKETNTEQQKVATFDLFASFFGERPLRQVTRADASAFADALRQLDPNWARTGKAKKDAPPMSWKELQKTFGGRDKGLSDATVNRHMATLTALWKWAETREHCTGPSPFQGHRRQLKDGRNKLGYVAWEPKELERLFSPPPVRTDLTEVMIVGMFTGMRLNEIVSLTCGQIGVEDGVTFIEITDAKTVAGERKVPLHPKLAWLATRAKKGKPGDRLWPKFNPEGPGGKPGGDAGKEFSRFKRSLGFTDRRKVFHSFRKNVVGQLERARVPQNEVAQLVGHEKQGLTFGVYGGMTMLQRLAEIVALIDYPGLEMPTVTA
ncbi:tyrosine-type recombinase/integrase [Novosphingobium sp. Chol11]|uniref:tyrosine-type recombinase/integrase n=1 Tax=Novosphingobium sp. Chol11 TaxID=1385763 RepID=UPI000BE4291B|nr:tyrosine-type recombinase/integrase [Novosphingobium sp. Chol11]